MDFTDYGDGTRAVHAGVPEPVPGQPFLPGPVFASTYPLDPATGPVSGVDSYGRPDNATRRRFEEAVGQLEGGDCVSFATGMAAVTALLFTVAYPGDTVVLPADGYYSTRRFADAALRGRGVTIEYAPTAGPYPSFEGVTLVLLETPANPGLEVCDIADLAERAHRAGALLAVDNTTPTPLGQRPLDLGADLSIASGTKALTGHSDVMIGYVAARDAELAERVRAFRKLTGGLPGPFDCWLAHRSLATVDLRLARQAENPAAVSEVLATHPAVEWVRWPGRPADPAYALARRQMRRMPGVVTFSLAGAAEVERFLKAARLVIPATSFGGLHSTADRRAQWGDDVSEGLVRFSCGIEDPADLVADVRTALDAI